MLWYNEKLYSDFWERIINILKPEQESLVFYSVSG